MSIEMTAGGQVDGRILMPSMSRGQKTDQDGVSVEDDSQIS